MYIDHLIGDSVEHSYTEDKFVVVGYEIKGDSIVYICSGGDLKGYQYFLPMELKKDKQYKMEINLVSKLNKK